MAACNTVSWEIGKWFEFGYFLKVESILFPDGLDTGCKREELRRTLEVLNEKVKECG